MDSFYLILHSTKKDFDDFLRTSSYSNSAASSKSDEDLHVPSLNAILNALAINGDLKVHSTSNESAMSGDNNSSLPEVASNLHNSSLQE